MFPSGQQSRCAASDWFLPSPEDMCLSLLLIVQSSAQTVLPQGSLPCPPPHLHQFPLLDATTNYISCLSEHVAQFLMTHRSGWSLYGLSPSIF